MMSGKFSGPPNKRLRQTLLCFGTGNTSETSSRSVPALLGTVGLCIIITCINLYFVDSIHSSFNVEHIVLFIDLICVCVYLLYNYSKLAL